MRESEGNEGRIGATGQLLYNEQWERDAVAGAVLNGSRDSCGCINAGRCGCSGDG